MDGLPKEVRILMDLKKQVEELDVRVRDLVVCCKSCTNRLDKLEN
jgi:hypothetical protein